MDKKEEINAEINQVDSDINQVIDSTTEVAAHVNVGEPVEVPDVPKDDTVILETHPNDVAVVSNDVEVEPVIVHAPLVDQEKTEDIPNDETHVEQGETGDIPTSVSDPESLENCVKSLSLDLEHLNSEIIREEKNLETKRINERKSPIKYVLNLADDLKRAVSSGKAMDVTPMTLRESLEIIASTVTETIEYDFLDTEEITKPELVKPVLQADLPEDPKAQIAIYTDHINKLKEYLSEINSAVPTSIAYDKYMIKETIEKFQVIILEYYETLNPDGMPDVDSMIDAIGKIYVALLEELEIKYQLKHMESSVDSLFNPRLHNGCGVITGNDESKNNSIVEEISSGYLQGDHIYQKPMVIVYKYQPEEVNLE